MESDPNIIKKHIKENSKFIMSKEPEEKYRKTINEKIKYQIEDFIELSVYSNFLKKSIKLKTYMSLPDEKEFPIFKAIIINFHGLKCHSNETAPYSTEFCKHGIVSVAYDYRGHGLSEGTNGDTEDYNLLISDSELFILKVEMFFKEKFNGDKDKLEFLNKMFLDGFSMGGLMAFNVSRNNPHRFKGIIYHAPAFGTNLSFFDECMLSCLGYFYPLMDIPLENKPIMYKNPYLFENPDPIILKTNVKIRTFQTMYNNIKRIVQEFNSYESCFILIIPGCDKLVPPEKMFEFFEKSRSLDKEVLYYPNMWHGTHLEEEIVDIGKRVVKWIENRI